MLLKSQGPSQDLSKAETTRFLGELYEFEPEEYQRAITLLAELRYPRSRRARAEFLKTGHLKVDRLTARENYELVRLTDKHELLKWINEIRTQLETKKGSAISATAKALRLLPFAKANIEAERFQAALDIRTLCKLLDEEDLNEISKKANRLMSEWSRQHHAAAARRASSIAKRLECLEEIETLQNKPHPPKDSAINRQMANKYKKTVKTIRLWRTWAFRGKKGNLLS